MRLCRRDPAAFAEYVLRDRRSGARWRLAPFQREWYRILTGQDRFVIVQAPVNRGKSATFIEAFPLWLLGRMSHGLERHESIGIVCVTDDLSDPRVVTLRTYIEQAEADAGNLETIGGRLHAVWPKLCRENRSGRMQKWTDSEFTIMRELVSPDASVIGGGIGSKRFGGKRFGWLIFDDPESEPELVESEAWRKKADRWIWGQAMGRVERETGRFIMAGTPGYPRGAPGHPGGPMADAEGQAGFAIHRFPAPGLPPAEYSAPRTMCADDPVRWPESALAEERRRYPAKRYEQLVWLKPFTSADRFFSPASVDLMRTLGAEYPMLPTLPKSARSGRVMVLAGLDPSSGEAADDTAIVVSLIGGPVDHTLHLRRGKWDMVTTLRQMLQVQRLYEVNYWGCESNAVQKWLRQAARSPQILAAIGATPEEAHSLKVIDTSTRAMDKTDPAAIQSMALDFEAGKRAIQGTPEGEILLGEIFSWTISGHTGDYLSALWQQEQLKRRMRPRSLPKPASTPDAAIPATDPSDLAPVHF